MNLREYIPVVPDWPRPGVNFLDITGVLEQPRAFAHCANWLSSQIRQFDATSIVAVESRGFPLAAVAAKALDLPLILARKKDKLPGPVWTQDYDTEYSRDSVSIKQSSPVGARPYIVDDILATGGTAEAVATLINSHWAVEQVACGVTIALDFLPGYKLLVAQGIHTDVLLHYE